ncbi:hypothetical protein BLOT_010944 [Blomia tropicalis]|nr:hypothetical protein BLOT_010944 [Blomia tropicalis]
MIEVYFEQKKMRVHKTDLKREDIKLETSRGSKLQTISTDLYMLITHIATFTRLLPHQIEDFMEKLNMNESSLFLPLASLVFYNEI